MDRRPKLLYPKSPVSALGNSLESVPLGHGQYACLQVTASKVADWTVQVQQLETVHQRTVQT
jgi:hypothetical protein